MDVESTDLYAALATLTPDVRELVWERYWAGKSVNQIAAERGKSKQAISAALLRARGQMAEYLSAVAA